MPRISAQGQTLLHSELEARLGYMRSYVKGPKEKLVQTLNTLKDGYINSSLIGELSA